MDWSNIALSLWFDCNVYAEYLLIVVMFKIVEKCWTFADWQWEPDRGDARIIGAVVGSKLCIVLSACGWNTLYLVKCGTTITTSHLLYIHTCGTLSMQKYCRRWCSLDQASHVNTCMTYVLAHWNRRCRKMVIEVCLCLWPYLHYSLLTRPWQCVHSLISW